MNNNNNNKNESIKNIEIDLNENNIEIETSSNNHINAEDYGKSENFAQIVTSKEEFKEKSKEEIKNDKIKLKQFDCYPNETNYWYLSGIITCSLLLSYGTFKICKRYIF